MSNFKLKATHAPVKKYYETLERFGRGKFDNEGNVRRAFEALLEKCAGLSSGWWCLSFQFPARAETRRRWTRRCWTPSIFCVAIGRRKGREISPR